MRPYTTGVICMFALQTSPVRLLANTIQYNTIQYNAMQCNAMQCNAMRCDAMRCDAMRCDAMRCDAMRCDAMRCDAMRYDTMRRDGTGRDATQYSICSTQNKHNITMCIKNRDDWKGPRGRTEEESYYVPPTTLINIHCQNKSKCKKQSAHYLD